MKKNEHENDWKELLESRIEGVWHGWRFRYLLTEKDMKEESNFELSALKSLMQISDPLFCSYGYRKTGNLVCLEGYVYFVDPKDSFSLEGCLVSGSTQPVSGSSPLEEYASLLRNQFWYSSFGDVAEAQKHWQGGSVDFEEE